ncbi:MAG: hypothetical protein AB7R55_17425 [Gemmatimonadales bacterium]
MRRSIAGLVLAATACGVAEGASDRFVIDSTGSGIPRVTSQAPNGWRDSSSAWRLVPSQVYVGDEGTEGALVDPQSLAVDDGGRVYVADQKPATIKVFGPDGRFVRSNGREGKGPGEFAVAFLGLWKDRLVVHDPRSSRTSVFDTAGAFLTSWNSACCYWTDIQVDSAGLVYIPSPNFDRSRDDGPRTRNPWVRYDFEGKVVDTLWVPFRESDRNWTLSGGSGGNRMMMQLSVPYTPQFNVALHPSGGFVVGWGDGYEIARSPSGLDTTLLIRREWSAPPIPEERRLAAIEQQVAGINRGGAGQFDEATLRSVFKLADVPSEAPAFETLSVDRDGNVWARQLLASDSTRTTWDVFDPRGVWIGPVSVAAPIGKYGAVWYGSGAIYASGEDDLGRPVITRYQLDR